MKRAVMLLIAALLVAAPARAQSLFSARGLGLPVAPVDARARALGGIGVGLLGLNTSMVNPAELAGFSRRGVTGVLQPTYTDITIGDANDKVSGTRFPLVHAVLPVGQRVVLGLGYGAAYDQFWSIQLQDTVMIGTSRVGVTDVVRSDGGLGQARLTAAVSLARSFSIGAAVGLYTGSLERQVDRTFGDSINYNPFTTQIRWDYSGVVGAVGARWDPDPAVRLAASATFGSDIEADGKEGDAVDRSFATPLRVAFGASGLLGTELIATLGAEWSEGEEATSDGAALPLATAAQTWRVGGGLEWTGRPAATRAFPIRLGGSWAALPYHMADEEKATEWTVGGGIGMRLADAAREPYAAADVTLERGGRTGFVSPTIDGGLEESFWRVTISLSLFGR